VTRGGKAKAAGRPAEVNAWRGGGINLVRPAGPW
jgi:hypothetical protein